MLGKIPFIHFFQLTLNWMKKAYSQCGLVLGALLSFSLR